MTAQLTRRAFSRLAGATAVAAAAGAAPLRAAKARVVVIGGGPGGIAAARRLAAEAPEIDVTLIEAEASYTTCYFSNHYIGGLRSFESITHTYERLGERLGVLRDRAVDVDAERHEVTLANGGTIAYDRLIVAPGIDFNADAIEGYDSNTAQTMPHAWRGGAQARLLRQQIEAMDDGGVVLIAPPVLPYRCPPGPYERASLVAQYLMQHKPRSKVVILDAKDNFAIQKLFEDSWLRFYPDMIEWLPAEFTGGLVAVDAQAGTVMSDDETFQPAVANVIPPQRAGVIAQRAGLADESGWCPVDPHTLASRLQPDIHVLGDAIDAGHLPKSAFAASGQGKLCAAAVRSALTGAELETGLLDNACWSLVASGHAVTVGGRYAPGDTDDPDGFGERESFVSLPDETDAQRAATAQEAEDWYAKISLEMFG